MICGSLSKLRSNRAIIDRWPEQYNRPRSWRITVSAAGKTERWAWRLGPSWGRLAAA